MAEPTPPPVTGTMPFCGACGYDTKLNANHDIWCDSCGEDLTIHGFHAPHHTTVDDHVYTSAEMRLATVADDGPISNLVAHVKGPDISGAESDMLVDGLANDTPDAIQLDANTGLVWLFTTPIHLLETLAGVYDPLASAVANPAFMYWSGDTTNGSDGSWSAIHSHVYDFMSDPHLGVDDPIPSSFPPLMTNLQNVKGIMVLGNGADHREFVEWKIWVPKTPDPAPPVADESPCDRLPASNAVKADLVSFLED